MHYMTRRAYMRMVLSLVACCLMSCKDQSPSRNSDSPDSKSPGVVATLSDTLERSYEGARSTLDSITPDRDDLTEKAQEEIMKLHAFEYKVTDLPPEASLEELQEELSALGRERWDCFSVVQGASSARLLCKRRPSSYLRYVPHMRSIF